jgi:UDP-sulfoquinovose synthase
VRIINQMTETHRVRDLAAMISGMTGVPVEHQHNPRKEAAENDLRVANDTLIKLGLEPTRLSDGLMTEVVEVARRYAGRCDRAKIVSQSRWVRAEAAE